MKFFDSWICKNKFEKLIIAALPFWFFSFLYFFSNIRTTFFTSGVLILAFLYLFINPVKNTIYTSPDGKNKIIVLTSYIFDQIYDIEAKPAINNFLYKDNSSSLISIRGTPPVCIKWTNNSKTASVRACEPSNPEYDTEIIIIF